MRTVSTPITAKEREELLKITDVSKLKGQTDIVEDLYSFMKKPDIVTDDDVIKSTISEFVLGKHEYYLAAKAKADGRIEFFNKLLNHPYYEKFKELKPMESAKILLQMLNAFKDEMKQQGQDDGQKQEKDETTKQFEEIIRYGMELFNLISDPYFQQMMQKRQQSGGSGSSDKPENMPEQVRQMVRDMAKEIAIYDLSLKLEFTIRMSKKGKYNKTDLPDNGLDVSRIEKMRDVTLALPSQLMMDDDIFLKKLASKELLKKQYMARKEKRQVLYLLVDRSGSMGRIVNSKKNLTALDVSKAVCIALMKKLIENKDLFYFRWFDDTAGRLYTVKTYEDSLKFMPKLIYDQTSGGGTSIHAALQTAAEDIKAKKLDQVELADILLISDGDAVVDHTWVNNLRDNKMDLHTVFINDHKVNMKDINDPYCSLVKASKNFLCTDASDTHSAVQITNLLAD